MNRQRKKWLILTLSVVALLTTTGIGTGMYFIFYNFTHFLKQWSLSDYKVLPNQLKNYLQTTIKQKKLSYQFSISPQGGPYLTGSQINFINGLNSSTDSQFWSNLLQTSHQNVLQELQNILSNHDIVDLTIDANQNKAMVKYDGQTEELKIAPLLLQHNFATDTTGTYDKFGVTELIPDESSKVDNFVWKYRYNFSFLVTFVLYNQLSTAYTETNITYRDTIPAVTSPLSIYQLLSEKIPSMQALLNLSTSIPTTFTKQRFAIMQNIIQRYYVWNNYVSFLPTLDNFWIPTAQLQIRYDNRYLNPKRDLNAKLLTVHNSQKAKLIDLWAILRVINSQYQPLSLKTINFNPTDVNDNYSGNVPGQPSADNEASWGTQTSTFNGGIEITLWNYEYQKNINYTQTKYNNNSKNLQSLLFGLHSQLFQSVKDVLNEATYQDKPPQTAYPTAQNKLRALATGKIDKNIWFKNNFMDIRFGGFSWQATIVTNGSTTVKKTSQNLCEYTEQRFYAIPDAVIYISFKHIPTTGLAIGRVSHKTTNIFTRKPNPDGSCPPVNQLALFQKFNLWG